MTEDRRTPLRTDRPHPRERAAVLDLIIAHCEKQVPTGRWKIVDPEMDEPDASGQRVSVLTVFFGSGSERATDRQNKDQPTT